MHRGHPATGEENPSPPISPFQDVNSRVFSSFQLGGESLGWVRRDVSKMEFGIPTLLDLMTKRSTYAPPVADSPGGRDRALPQVAGVDAGGLSAGAVDGGLVAVLIILLPGVYLATGDEPLFVALSTGH